MKFYSLIFILTFIAINNLASAQQDTLRGIVVDITNNSKTPLPGAFVRWTKNIHGVYTDRDGVFELVHDKEAKEIEVSFITYTTVRLSINTIDSFYVIGLESDGQLEPVNILSRFKTYGLSGIEPRTTINLSEREFQKAACCNLSESFQNAPAIDVSFGDAVTGTRQIKMLGLDGFYTLITREFMPSVRTLNSYYGMSFIPSTWVKSIQITKGAGSIVNGYESIAGQINIEMKKPFDKEKFILDQFISESGRSETDIMQQWNLGQHVATSLFAKLALYTTKQDRNNDGFIDNPFGRQIALLNRWQFYTDNNFEGQLNASYNNDQKTSGQYSFLDEDNDRAYGIEIQNEQWDVWAKVGKVFPDKPHKSLGSQFRFNHSELSSRYGSEIDYAMYDGTASTFYGNLMYESILFTTFHKLKTGVSLLADRINEQYLAYSFHRDEVVPGAFAEYTYQPKEQLSFVGGIRTDYNSIYGWSFTPRFHSKWRFNKDKTSLRTSIGLGRRTSNIFAQNQQIFASSRNFQLIRSNDFGAYGLEQERALNTGLSFEHEFKISYFPATLYLDYFYTEFFNEVVLDREKDGIASFYNMKDGTKSSSFQSQLDLNPFRRTDIRIAYRIFDVSTVYRDYGRLSKPFISKHRAFVNITQGTRTDWQFSSTLQWYGPQRIAGIDEIGGTFPGPPLLSENYSPSFFLWNFQVSKTFKFPLELYVGAENILNYKQAEPIKSAENPFADEFDAGLVWGPIFGRMIYGGFRIRINYKEPEKVKPQN